MCPLLDTLKCFTALHKPNEEKIINTLSSACIDLSPNVQNYLKILNDSELTPFNKIKQVLESLDDDDMERLLRYYSNGKIVGYGLHNLSYEDVCVLQYCDFNALESKLSYLMFVNVLMPLIYHYHLTNDECFNVSIFNLSTYAWDNILADGYEHLVLERTVPNVIEITTPPYRKFVFQGDL